MADEVKREGEAEVSPFRIIPEIYQAQAEAFELEFERLGGLSSQGASVIAGAALRAAIKAGWIQSPDSEVMEDSRGQVRHFYDGLEVDRMRPGEVKRFGLEVYRKYRLVTAIDPN